jgi:hypothetical protein
MHPLPFATNTDPQVVLAGFSDLPPKPPGLAADPAERLYLVAEFDMLGRPSAS